MELSHNGLTGSIPSELSNLDKLFTLLFQPAGDAKLRQVVLPRRASVGCRGSAKHRCHDESGEGRCGGSVEEVIGDDVGGVDDFDVVGGGMQDGSIAESVDEARQAAGVAMDVGLGVIGEDRGGAPAASGVVVDVGAGLLQGHGRHVVGDACAGEWRRWECT